MAHNYLKCNTTLLLNRKKEIDYFINQKTLEIELRN